MTSVGPHGADNTTKARREAPRVPQPLGSVPLRVDPPSQEHAAIMCSGAAARGLTGAQFQRTEPNQDNGAYAYYRTVSPVTLHKRSSYGGGSRPSSPAWTLAA